jgi:hypothetical protein
MARLARIVIPEVAHHVTQCGNRHLPIFFNYGDSRHKALIALCSSAMCGARIVLLGP